MQLLQRVPSALTDHYQGTTSTEDMDQGQTAGSFNWRAEDGVIQSQNVFLVRKHAMALHIIWKSRYLLKAYSATKLKKILIFIIGTGSRFVIATVDLLVETVRMRQQNSILEDKESGQL
uniref:Uncharacterized protein n=1 Tax=Salix viminalis TaxID=40686 RepID=A0A6N2MY94_SALVM